MSRTSQADTQVRTRMDGAVRRRLLAVLAGVMIGATPSQADVTSNDLTDTTPSTALPRENGGVSADLLSAFFGLDNGLPLLSRLICQGAPGRDGMPVIFSTEIDHRTMQAGDFRVTTASGATGRLHCVTLLPATDAGELRTVLLVGELGDAETDPPVSVEIVGHLHSIDGQLDFRGARIDVTPLASGPSLVMAEVADAAAKDLGLGRRRTDGDECPTDGIVQAVRVVWAGGVVLANGNEPGAAVRDLYRVTVRGADGTERQITPAALADLGDGDNNHLLCLDTGDRPVSVSFPAGVLVDPNGDLNPATLVAVRWRLGAAGLSR
ncbi:hypothetical protein [Falsiroseomonas selenitidurans]|uniref:Phytase-like domain-containing protein n=1 Tax=Falsiroseomonas selenitidurans TaxID=2716335 RepID=A0ABX1EAT6_9PROT|nr:hypothetical protein [Falsiroseomonas selenitidurans]NKC34340.1 hypothetical protein [Falsiroseomonas selenitidurans]